MTYQCSFCQTHQLVGKAHVHVGEQPETHLQRRSGTFPKPAVCSSEESFQSNLVSPSECVLAVCVVQVKKYNYFDFTTTVNGAASSDAQFCCLK